MIATQEISAQRSVVWIPAPLASGSQSMDRYWRELQLCEQRQFRPEFVIRSLVKGPPKQSLRASRWKRAWERYVEYPMRVRAQRYGSIFHLLDHSHAHVLPLLKGKGKTIVTVHDLIPLRDSTGLTLVQVERFRNGVSKMRQADLILADSDYTAADVRALLGEECPPLRTLPLGVDVARFQSRCLESEVEALNLPSGVPVVLCVGSELARKNMQIVPAVLARVLDEIQSVCVIKIGSRFDPSIKVELKRLGSKLTVREFSSATEGELVAAYQRADLLLFPSLLEGFGLPVLEAMAAGTPVVASNASSIPEVGLEACMYFSPEDPEAAAKAIITVLNDLDQRERMIAKGRIRAEELDWHVHFEKLCDIYCEVIL